MHFVTRSVITMLALALAGCAPSMRIQTDADPNADFSGYRTYTWLPLPQGGDRRVNNPTVASRITSAVDATLNSKGLHKQTSGDPDFFVGYHAALQGRTDATTVNTYYGYGWGAWGPPYATTAVRYFEQGTLIIDIVDAASMKLVWRGSAEAEIDRAVDEQKRRERANDAVRKIFADFPRR